MLNRLRLPQITSETPRHLPAELYGKFDIRPLADGSKQYSLPYRLGPSVIAFTTHRRVVAPLGGIALVVPLIFPETEAAAPLASYWLYAGLMFFALHGCIAIACLAGALVTGIRKITRITIRPDGLVIDDKSFFAAEHIWQVKYGTTSNKDTAAEVFEPKIEFMIGTNLVTVADGIEVEPARLFMRLFSDDTRRYWARHN